MPPIVAQNAPPSTIIDVIGQVIDAFDACGDATLVQVGGQYIDQFGVGHGPKVLFVPEAPGTGGTIAGGTRLGNAAKQIHGCNVYVRADEETGDDLARFDQLYALNDFVVDLVSTAGTGRLTWGACSDESPLKVSSGIGCALGWSFTYERDIQHGVKRWRGPLRDVTGAPVPTPLTVTADTSSPTLPTSPAAIESDDVDITLTVTPE